MAFNEAKSSRRIIAFKAKLSAHNPPQAFTSETEAPDASSRCLLAGWARDGRFKMR